MGVVDARSIGQCVELRGKVDEARRHRQFDPKLVELVQIVPYSHLALTAQGAHKGIHIHIRVAVPVAANPGAHLKEPRHSHAQPFFKVRIKMRDLSKEARPIEPERILDFVCDGEMREPQKPRLPELDDPGPHQGLVAFEVALAAQGFPSGEQVLDSACAVKNAAALHLRWMP